MPRYDAYHNQVKTASVKDGRAATRKVLAEFFQRAWIQVVVAEKGCRAPVQ